MLSALRVRWQCSCSYSSRRTRHLRKHVGPADLHQTAKALFFRSCRSEEGGGSTHTTPAIEEDLYWGKPERAIVGNSRRVGSE